jgi:A/G-specific adenine glycosylase
MLQQTQVAVVVPYYCRWMERFPTVRALASASIDEVIKLWEGLGYYSRARNLHAAARQIVSKWGGELPEAHLSSLPGFGPYTTNALRAFAFHRRVAAVDGNVKRVMSRFYTLSDLGQVQAKADAFLPDVRPWEVAEALIELGATLCSRKPQCNTCPLAPDCKAKALGAQDQFPPKKPRPKMTDLIRSVAVIRSGEKYLVRKNGEGKVMADLYEFPYIEGKHWGGQVVRHTFTRFRATLHVAQFEISSPIDGEWVTLEEARRLPFSSGHRQILSALPLSEVSPAPADDLLAAL